MKQILNYTNFDENKSNENEIRDFIIPYLEDEHDIKVDKSLNKNFNWFIPYPEDELPENVDELSEDEYQETCGTHLKSDKELVDFAVELGYITDEEVFGD